MTHLRRQLYYSTFNIGKPLTGFVIQFPFHPHEMKAMYDVNIDPPTEFLVLTPNQN